MLVLDEGLDGPASEFVGIYADSKDLAAGSSRSRLMMGVIVKVLGVKDESFT